MFVDEFDTPAIKFNKIQKYLKENFGFEIDVDKMTFSKANKIIINANKKLKEQSITNNPTYAKLKLISEGLQLWKLSVSKDIYESIGSQGMQQAKVIIAAQEITDKIQKMIEDVASLQIKDIVQISDAMKVEIGNSEAERFFSSTEKSLGELLDLLKTTKTDVSNAILVASGETVDTDMAKDFDNDLDMPRRKSSKLDTDNNDSDEFGGIDASSINRPLKAESIMSNKYLLALKEMQKQSKSGKIQKKKVASIKNMMKS